MEFGGHTPYLSLRAARFRGGIINVNPILACIGDTITFTLSGVVDSGGQKRENCVVVPDGPVTPEYEWTLTIPPDYPDAAAAMAATEVANRPWTDRTARAQTSSPSLPPHTTTT